MGGEVRGQLNEELVGELIASARRLLEEGRTRSAVLLVKEVFNIMGLQEKARVLGEAVVQGVRVDVEYVENLIEEVEKTMGKGRGEQARTSMPSIPWTIKLLIALASIQLILVSLNILPPLGDAIAISLAVLLMIIVVDCIASTRKT